MTERVNDPRTVDDGPPRPAVVRGDGLTDSERYLAVLAEKSFLNLWCYPNAFIDKKSGNSGDGKELCDLLVVCGDHILIFSDKTVAWPAGDDLELAWKRWFKRAIHKSADQIRGAERWIAQFPDRIFIDKKCTERLPLELPPVGRRKVHGIIVANGSASACRDFFREGRGSLMVVPAIQGDTHYLGDSVEPFAVGDVDATGSFIHVLDEATLDIVMSELDTIYDFTSYLTKKEELIRSGRLASAAGEEELVAQFMTRMNAGGEHDFTKPDGTEWADSDHVAYGTGFYTELRANPRYRAKKEADQVSYCWDKLITIFTDNMLAGTTLVPDGGNPALSQQELSVRYMATVPRFMRRAYGAGVLDALEQGQKTDKFMRAFLPQPGSPAPDTGFFFLTVKIPTFELKGGYEQYRSVRRSILEAYALTLLRRNPGLARIIGIATEPRPAPGVNQGSSEDLIYAAPPEWTEQLLAELEQRQKAFGIAQPENARIFRIQGDEFPEVPRVG